MSTFYFRVLSRSLLVLVVVLGVWWWWLKKSKDEHEDEHDWGRERGDPVLNSSIVLVLVIVLVLDPIFEGYPLEEVHSCGQPPDRPRGRRRPRSGGG
jgi:hypothetical protein